MSHVGPVFTFGFNGFFYWNHLQSLILSWAGIDAAAATEAVHRADLHSELETSEFLASSWLGDHAFRLASHFFFVEKEWADSSVWANQGALVALDAVFWNPFWNEECSHTFFVLGGTGWECTIFKTCECADRKLVALHSSHWTQNLLNEFWFASAAFFGGFSILSVSPSSWNLYFMQNFDGFVYSIPVHLNDSVTLAAIGLLDGILEELNGFFKWQYASELEECSLGNHVGTVAETNFLSNLGSVDGVELDVVLSDVALHACWQVFFEFFWAPGAVQKEGTIWLETFEHVIKFYIAGLVASNIVSLVNFIGGTDLTLTETQGRNGYAATLLGVVGEVTLSIHVGVVTDDLDGVFVCTNGTVGAVTPELASDAVFRSGNNRSANFERGVGNIIHDTNGEVVLRSVSLEVFINSDELSWGNILGT